MSSPFGSPNPEIALPPAPTPPPKPGPLHMVEFVIEIVGPQSIPAQAAAALLAPNWFQALGEPKLWVMSPQDTTWQPLTASTSGSYDSLSLCWPYVTSKGNLSCQSAANLMATAEKFAQGIQRRAMPLPPPEDVDRMAHSVADVVNCFDIGVSLGVVFVSAVAEDSIWRTAIELGLTLDSLGQFVWGAPPQLVVSPTADPAQFTLGGVQNGAQFDEISVGFSAPQVVDPLASLDAALRVADEYARRFRGMEIGEDGEPLTQQARAQYRQNLQSALQAFGSAALKPGSAEAVRLFGS